MLGKNCLWDSIWARGIYILDGKECSCSTENRFDDGLVYSSDCCEKYFWVSLPASLFTKLADRQRQLIELYLWCPDTNLYYDYDCATSLKSVYKTCTALWALWAQIPSPEKAQFLVKACLEHFEVAGGIVSGTEESRGVISLCRPSRQWDYPFGWAPHQILAWKGLQNYGFEKEMERIVYRWLFSITKSFVEYNGVVPEKFDVVNVSHIVQVCSILKFTYTTRSSTEMLVLTSSSLPKKDLGG